MASCILLRARGRIRTTDGNAKKYCQSVLHLFISLARAQQDLMLPLRFALTGMSVGAGVADTLVVLGREEVRSRLLAFVRNEEEQAADWCGKE